MFRLGNAITNDERGDDPGSTIITVCQQFYDTLTVFNQYKVNRLFVDRAKFLRLGFASGEPLGAKTSMKKAASADFVRSGGEPLARRADA